MSEKGKEVFLGEDTIATGVKFQTKHRKGRLMDASKSTGFCHEEQRESVLDLSKVPRSESLWIWMKIH